MSQVAEKPADRLYERDFLAWTRWQARALRDKRTELLDLPNLVDEVESLSRSMRRAIESHLIVLIAHLLKLSVQPKRATPSWRLTIRNERSAIEKLVRRSPSLKSYPEQILADAYADAVRLAADETGLEDAAFPGTSPFVLAEILNPSFLPR